MTTMARVNDGWRSGRPLEDPAKTKRWGFVAAKPSEFLVHCRRGRVLGSSGQGATCFKWPWDAVAVVPTSLQKIGFAADQVTRERVGVAVSGLAVYRIASPLCAFRLLNFSYPERAQEKLESTLSEMLMGATRRLVANLTVDECLEKRKAALADELLREVAPVVGGSGRPDDETDGGWGVVVDTIEIQEVRVLSERVFAAMQAPFRAGLDRQARIARADADRQSALAEAAAQRDVEQATIEAEAVVRARRAEVSRLEAEEEIQGHELMVQARELAAARDRIVWQAELERRRAMIEMSALEGHGDAEVGLARSRATQAAASPLGSLATALASVLDPARRA
jgi:flotillin